MTFGGAVEPQRRNLRFKFAFICITPECRYEIDRTTFRAVVEGPGAEVVCPRCNQLYLVDVEGAHPITPEMIAQVRETLHKQYATAPDMAITNANLAALGITPRFPRE